MKRGNPSTLTPAALADLERLWCHTTFTARQIAEQLTAAHGPSPSWDDHARRRGLERPPAVSTSHPATVASCLALASLTRATAPGRPADNPVRKTGERFAVPVGGYRIGGMAFPRAR